MLTGQRPFLGSGVSEVLATILKEEPDFALLGEREVLFESDAFLIGDYDVDLSGRLFLMVEKRAEEMQEDRTRQRVNLIFNWFDELERLVPTE